MSKSILVGVDEHPTARDAVVLGSALAAAIHDALVVAHIYPADPLAASRALGAPPADPWREEAIDIVREAVSEIAPEARIVAAPAHSVAQGLHEQATEVEADVIVVGSSHRGSVGRGALGTHATRVIHGAPCAVAVAPRGLAQQDVRLRSIAVALDGSDESLDALDFARRLAATTGGELRLVTVVPPQTAQWGRYRYAPERLDYDERATDQARQVLTVARPGEETEIRAGHVPTELLDVTKSVDLLVTGSRTHGPTRRLLLGSVSDPVVRNSSCPVLVMPRSARTEKTVTTPTPSVATT